VENIVQYRYQTSCFFKAGLLLFALFPSKLSAQDIPAKADTTHQLKEINISTSKLPNVQTLAPAQQVTNADFIHSSAYNVADAIRSFAGVNIKDYGGIGGLKTVSVRSLGADNTALLYNGVVLSDAQNGQIDLSKFNLNNVREIALYNAQPLNICQTAKAFASASVLSVNTIIPELTKAKPCHILAEIKYGSFGLVNPYLQWQQRLSKRWSFLIDCSEEYATGNYKYKVGNEASDTLAVLKNDQVNNQQIDAGLYWAKSDSDKFNLQVNYYHSDRGLPGPNILYATAPNQYLHGRDIFIQAGYGHIAKKGLRYKINAKASQNYLNYFDSQYFNLQGYLNENYTQREGYLSGVLAYKLAKNWEISYASDAALSNLKSDVYNYAFPTRLSLFNVLATDYTLGRWHLQANLLNTYIHDNVETGVSAVSRNKFTPTIIASVQPLNDPNFVLRAFYKSTFRNPTFAEQYYYAIVPRPLRPEYNQQFNLGATYSKSLQGVVAYIVLTADAYYNNVNDKIIFVPTRSPETPSATNLGNVEIEGLDINLKTTFNINPLLKGLLSASYTYQQALDITNPSSSYYLQQIPYTPVNTAAINAGFTYKQLGVYYNEVITSSRYNASDHVPLNYLPGYAVSDASVVYHFLTGRTPITVSAEANNILNKNYAVNQNLKTNIL
jgi:vitamin B12 transporter